MYISKEELLKLYTINRKSIREIANIYGVSKEIIFSRLKEYEIKRRTTSETKNKYNLTKEMLINELKTKNQTELANEIGCDPSLISYYIIKNKKESGYYK